MRKCSLHIYFWVLLAIASLASCKALAHVSDEVLIEKFHSHQADFEKLVTMLEEDRGLVRLTADRVFFKNDTTSISNERLAEYRRLLKLLTLTDGITRDPDGLHLIVSTRGMVGPNSAKSYSYTLKESSALVDSLDAIIKQNPGDQRPVWRRISGNWYLSYESW